MFSSKLSPLSSYPYILAYFPRYLIAKSKVSLLYSSLSTLHALQPLGVLRGERITHSLSLGEDIPFHSELVKCRLKSRPSSSSLPLIPLLPETTNPHPFMESKNFIMPITLLGLFCFLSLLFPGLLPLIVFFGCDD